MKMLDAMARGLSVVFSPLLVPTYAIILVMTTTFLAVTAPLAARIVVTAVVFVVTAVVPMGVITLFKRMGVVSDVALTERTERTLPFLLAIVCYMGCALFLYRAGCPGMVTAMFIGTIAAVVVQIIVNRWWKISAHAAGMGGFIAFMSLIPHYMIIVVDTQPWLLAAIPMAGAVGTARILRHRHTAGQVMAGYVNGFLCVWCVTLLLANTL